MHVDMPEPLTLPSCLLAFLPNLQWPPPTITVAWRLRRYLGHGGRELSRLAPHG